MPRKRQQIRQVAAVDMGELEEGQDWDDPLQIALRRDQAHIALMALSMMFGDTQEGLAEMRAAARQGDLTALLVGPHLVQSLQDVQDTMRAIALVTNPALMAEVDSLADADAAEAEAEADRRNAPHG